jgi:hypothetical protein
MATLTLRNVKGSALTHDELDSNFGALDSDITVINTTLASGVGLGADSVNSLIDTRIDSSDFSTTTEINALIDARIDSSDFSTTTEINALIDARIDSSDFSTTTEINALIDARIDSDTFVTLTGNQTIGGVKTFSDSVVFSGPIFGDASNFTGIGDSDNFVTLTGTQTVAGAKTFTDTIDFDNFMTLTGAGGTQYIAINGGLDIQDNSGSLGTLFAINGTTGAMTIPRSAVAGTQTASVSGATTLNFATYQNFVLTLTGATTLSNPTTETVGQSGFITFIQDGTGSRAVSLGSDFETAAAGGLTLSSGAAETDMVPYIVIASGRILLGTPQLAFG